jgi:hypothetical protein
MGGSNKSDIVYGVHFDDTGETAWFAPHLVEDAPEPDGQ